jgi:hypothetical protein
MVLRPEIAKAERTRSLAMPDQKNLLWILPALYSLGFFVYSIGVVINHGLYAVVEEFLGGGWHSQIGIDLFACAIAALVLGSTRAQRLGVRMWPWVVFTFATGSVGLMAFVARVLYLEGSGQRAAAPATAAARTSAVTA